VWSAARLARAVPEGATRHPGTRGIDTALPRQMIDTVKEDAE
jgi:hypothetical protein